MMKRSLPIFACVGAMALAGCTSGTTYGTGVSHEEQTLGGLYNMLSIKSADAEDIDYSARPDLVMPANKEALPVPGDNSAEQVAGDQNWPETPEQRIAAVRSEAPEVDDRSGLLPTEYLTSEKKGIRNSSGLYAAARATRADEELPIVDPNEQRQSEEIRRRREQLAYSTGVKRKFLTEPPSEYRKPADTAQAGDLGVTSEQLLELEKKAKEEERNRERGVLNAIE